MDLTRHKHTLTEGVYCGIGIEKASDGLPMSACDWCIRGKKEREIGMKWRNQPEQRKKGRLSGQHVGVRDQAASLDHAPEDLLDAGAR